MRQATGGGTLAAMPTTLAPTLRRAFSLAVAIFALAGHASAQSTAPAEGSDDARMELAREVLRLTHARETAQLATDSTLFTLRRGGQVSKAFIAEYQSLIDLDLMMEETAKVYAKAYSAPELQAAIDFFRTPLGQSYAAKMPQVAFASMLVGQRLGEQWSAAAHARTRKR